MLKVDFKPKLKRKWVCGRDFGGVYIYVVSSGHIKYVIPGAQLTSRWSVCDSAGRDTSGSWEIYDDDALKWRFTKIYHISSNAANLRVSMFFTHLEVEPTLCVGKCDTQPITQVSGVTIWPPKSLFKWHGTPEGTLDLKCWFRILHMLSNWSPTGLQLRGPAIHEPPAVCSSPHAETKSYAQSWGAVRFYIDEVVSRLLQERAPNFFSKQILTSIRASQVALLVATEQLK